MSMALTPPQPGHVQHEHWHKTSVSSLLTRKSAPRTRRHGCPPTSHIIPDQYTFQELIHTAFLTDRLRKPQAERSVVRNTPGSSRAAGAGSGWPGRVRRAVVSWSSASVRCWVALGSTVAVPPLPGRRARPAAASMASDSSRCAWTGRCGRRRPGAGRGPWPGRGPAGRGRRRCRRRSRGRRGRSVPGRI